MHDDAEAFASLVGRWQETIRRLCFRLVGDAHRAEDIAQEVFTKIFVRRGSFQLAAVSETLLDRPDSNTTRP